MVKDRRRSVGGIIAAKAIKAGVGRKVSGFPPRVMLTEEERRRITSEFSRERSARGAERRAAKASAIRPPDQPPATAIELPGEAPATPGRPDPRDLLRRIANDNRIPPELRIEAFKLIV